MVAMVDKQTKLEVKSTQLFDAEVWLSITDPSVCFLDFGSKTAAQTSHIATCHELFCS